MKFFRKIAGFFYFASLLVSCKGNDETIDHITINGLDILYSVRGPIDGQSVVLMHGNGGSHKSMATQQLQLARAGYRVYCPDSRGQGANAPLQEYHYADMAEDCFLFIKALNLEKPIVGGWSDGGNNALLMEMAHPGTSSIIVAAGANLFPDCGEGFEEFKAWIINEGTPLALMMLEEPNINPVDLAAIKCPALITVGSKDLISVEHTKLISDNIPNSKLVIFERATHSSYIKRNPRFGRCMLEYFKSLGYESYPLISVSNVYD